MKREEKGEEEEEGKGVKERKKLVRVSETRRGRGSWWWLLIVVIDSSIGWNRRRIAREEGNLEPRVIFLIFLGEARVASRMVDPDLEREICKSRIE